MRNCLSKLFSKMAYYFAFPQYLLQMVAILSQYYFTHLLHSTYSYLYFRLKKKIIGVYLIDFRFQSGDCFLLAKDLCRPQVCMRVMLFQSCLTLGNPMDCSHPRDSPGKSTGVDCHFLLQGICLTQGFKQCLQGFKAVPPAMEGRLFTTSTTQEA